MIWVQILDEAVSISLIFTNDASAINPASFTPAIGK